MGAEKVTYDDQVTPILRNNCFKCHNPDKSKGDLDLTTYSAVLKGGGSGKSVLPGDPAGSKLIKAIERTEEPFMPSNGSKLSDADITVIRNWIFGGLLEKSTSQAMASNKPKLGGFSGSASKRPDGPMVLPVEWRLEPVSRIKRTTAVTALAASPWSPLVAVGGQHQLLVYHSGSLELLGLLPFPEVEPDCAQFSRDSRLLVVGGGEGAKYGFVDVYEIATGDRVVRVGNEFDTVLAADLNSDQTEVALGGPGKHVKVFSTRDGKLIRDLKKHTDWITAIQYSPDSVLLASGDRNGGLVVWEADTGQELYTLTGHKAAISALSWRDDSDVLLSASEDGSIRLWEMKEGREVANWNAHKDGVLDARFSHDAHVVSCGRDKKIALWDASGGKQRSWDAGGDLPVRVAFAEDGARIFASTLRGIVFVWLAADGSRVGEISSDPPTLVERLELASVDVVSREMSLKQSEEAFAAAEADAKKTEVAIAAQDQTSPAFQFAAATRQAQAAHRKAADEATRGLEPLKAAAAKSTSDLATAEADAAKTQAALDKVDKFSEPYKQLTKQIESAGQKATAAAAKASESGKTLADKTTAINTAASDLAAKMTVAVQARDKSGTALDELNKQSETAVRTLAQARGAADEDKAKLAHQQTSVSAAMTTMTNAENDVARLNAALAATNIDQAQIPELKKQLETATKQAADARAAYEGGGKTLGDLKTASEKSVTAADASETEVAKLKTAIESAKKASQAANESVAQLETAKQSAADAGKKEIEALQAAVARANSEQASAKAESADLQAKLDKTEKFSDAYHAAMKSLDDANKRVATLRTSVEHDRKEAADLEAAISKINSSSAAADAEAAKVLESLAKSDAGYQKFQELDKQLTSARQKASEAKTVNAKAMKEVEAAKAVITQIHVAQARMTLADAREALAASRHTNETMVAAVADAEKTSQDALKVLNEAKAALAAQPAAIDALRADVKKADDAVELAHTALREAGKTAAANPEAESTITLLVEKQNALKQATNQVQAAQKLVTTAENRLAGLTTQIKPLTATVESTAAKLETAKTAAAESTRQLATEQARVDKLAADYASLKGSAGASHVEAKL